MTRITARAARLARNAALAALLAAPFAVAPAAAQTSLTNQQILQGLTATTQEEPTITAQLLRQMAEQAVANNVPLDLNKSAVAAQLFKLAQITVQIQFALGSDIIRPESYATIGAISDALHHPILFNYHFLIVGNTDTTGTRANNLKLSQARADAVKQALVTVFGVDPARLEAVGLGQEDLQTPNDPTNPINRRVQLFNIGLE
ncbi:OmpA/MotB domain protein [Ancylobacter novellus DSM 506]|uniref:OmpA/MotB domain protein n=1 Tax=Ancylobacter novellus (strain ATCC 8093 / DSM 506 / JCM 20403 / CCM 1077 / IAM 12100 / NBRC 12443 / NCIMB 10456) TaxID=639283 RepID=D7A929_ANCN5|nr:OmpA family protein [Ancylobacter novellus]ADH88734.1 OmpA/MotB domain protein [Ancylobacter novellus DSM 506]